MTFDEKSVLMAILEGKLKGLIFGSVSIIIQDGKIVRIVKEESFKIEP